MKSLDLATIEHPNFVFIRATEVRINKSVAWLVRCKHCGAEQLVGASQAKRGTHTRCIKCQIPKQTQIRELPDGYTK